MESREYLILSFKRCQQILLPSPFFILSWWWIFRLLIDLLTFWPECLGMISCIIWSLCFLPTIRPSLLLFFSFLQPNSICNKLILCFKICIGCSGLHACVQCVCFYMVSGCWCVWVCPCLRSNWVCRIWGGFVVNSYAVCKWGCIKSHSSTER